MVALEQQLQAATAQLQARDAELSRLGSTLSSALAKEPIASVRSEEACALRPFWSTASVSPRRKPSSVSTSSADEKMRS